jgi:hypothetical protein
MIAASAREAQYDFRAMIRLAGFKMALICKID